MANLLNASDYLKDDSIGASTSETPTAERNVLGGLDYDASQLFGGQSGTSSVEDALPKTLNIAGMDTGIPLNKSIASVLVGMGDGMTDLWDGLTQMMGSEETRIALQAEQNMVNELYNDDRFGTKARVGQFGGFIADPVGVAMPMFKGKTLWDVAKIGMATGTTFGTLGYVDEESGQTRVGNALVGAVTAGVLSPALVGTARGVMGVGGVMQERAADGLLKSYKKEYYKYIAEGRTPTQASHFAMKRMGWTTEDKASLIMASGKEFHIEAPMPLKSEGGAPRLDAKGMPIYNTEVATANLRAMDNKLITNLSNRLDSSSIGRDVKSVAKSAMEGVKRGLIPISTRIAKVDPDLRNKLIQMEGNIKINQARLHRRAMPFHKIMKGLSEEKRKEVHLNLRNKNLSKASEIIRKETGDTKAYKEVNKVLKEIFDEARGVGYILPELAGYFPSRVKDIEGLSKKQGQYFSDQLKAYREKLKREPSDKEIQAMIANITNPHKKGVAHTGGSLRERQIEKVDEEDLNFYHDTEATLTSYINDMVTDIERAKFFSAIGNKMPVGGYKLDGTDLDNSLQQSLLDRQKKGQFHMGELKEITDILRSRFTQGEVAPSAAVQAFKNTTYIATLGNVKSAITQIGDLAFSAHRNGIVNTTLEMMNRIPLLRKVVTNSHKRITKEDVGLEEAMQEFAGDRNGKKALDWILTKTGFKAMDRLGKETFVNAHYRMVRKALNGKKGNLERAKMVREWQPIFGDETTKLIDDISKGNFNDNVAVYLFNQLSDVQPISLSEMPQAYLNNPNGRIMYMLRSFTIKQLDLMRRDVYDAMAKGDAPRAFKNMASLGTLFVMANGTADMMKDFVTGKDIEMEDTLVDNVWKLAGISRYTADKVSSGGVGSAFWDSISPPFTIWDRAIRSAGDPQKMWDASPFNGLQIFRDMFDSGELKRTDPTDDYFAKLDKFHD